MSSTNVVDKLSALESLLEGQLEEAVDYSRFGQSLEKVLKEIQSKRQNLKRLEDLVPCASYFYQNAYLQSQDDHRLHKLLNEIQSLGRSVESAKTKEELDSCARDVVELANRIDSLSSLLDSRWKQAINTRFGQYSQLKQVIDSCHLHDPHLRVAIESASRGALLRGRFPPTEEHLKEMETRELEIRSAIAQLESSQSGKDLIQFFLAVAAKKATLNDISPNLFAFLKEKNVLQFFRVELGI
ncbi:MAG: hypothetical protein ACO1RX_08285 [Candidatus Sericytochromatia bacterium]